ncbi:MAG: hypothetical protein EOP62_11565 [Sphingomonadales bacterium]|nr:MAG: hypothetical protein EOP62_11565 [Sphingomonadales bacterium]
MTDRQPMQADGGGGDQVNDDGVGGKPGDGESAGGAYPNPHSGKDPKGFDGGQSGKSYSGPDNPNATTE